MDTRYRYGHRPGRRRRTRVLIVLLVSLLILGVGGGIIGYDLYKNRNKPVPGTSRTIVQSLDENIDKLNIDEPTFNMELPGDWKEVGRQNTASEHSITWQASKKREDNRFLKLYIDTIPAAKSINRLLPVAAQGNSLMGSEVSDNCATFTPGGTLNATLAQTLKETPAKYKEIAFICDLPRVIDNEVGTGSTEGVNMVTVKGPVQGAHKYFFLYTDHNIQPNYSILDNAIKSFKAK
jgi:hypothetical protein